MRQSVVDTLLAGFGDDGRRRLRSTGNRKDELHAETVGIDPSELDGKVSLFRALQDLRKKGERHRCDTGI